MAVKKSEMYSRLWSACDKLRGGMDASQYKDYILTLLFVKYVSDKFVGRDFEDITIPEGGGFSDMLSLCGKPNIGEGMDKVIARLADAGDNNLRGIIDNVHFNDEDKFGKGKDMVDTLTKLINEFRDFDLSANRADGDDIIGDAYEYLMRKFATQSGKSKGQFYTPAEVSRVIAGIIGIDCGPKAATLYDPACGSGSLLIRAAGQGGENISVYGQEREIATRALAVMNFVLHSRTGGEVKSGNTFSDPQFFEEGSDTILKRFDFVVANPPFSLKNWTSGYRDFDRFAGYGARPPKENGDFAWLLHIIKSMKSTGKAAVILPHGVLFRGNAEGIIRREIIDRGYIKGIIGLPPNLFYGTGIPACIIVLDKEDADSRDGIFMIDAGREFMKDGDKNRLRERDVYKITTTFRNRITDDPHYARFVPMDEIRHKNDYNLNISRYISSGIKEDEQNINAHLFGGVPDDDINTLAPYWSVFGNLKGALFSAMRAGYSKLIAGADEVRGIIYADRDFQAFAGDIASAFAEWRSAVLDVLMHILPDTDAKRLIAAISEDILRIFEPLPLIDKYDAYQVLNAYWIDTMADDVYIIISDGYGAARGTESVKPLSSEAEETGKTKKRKKKDPFAWEGILLPKELVKNRFFSDDAQSLASIAAELEDEQSRLDAVIDEADEDSVVFDVLNGDGKVGVKKLKSTLKLYSDGTDERALLEELLYRDAKVKELKEAKKAAEIKLNDDMLAKYAALTDDEIFTLLIDCKWLAAVKHGIDELYDAVCHRLTDRVTELARRYERTVTEIEAEAAMYEARVKEHLGRMGF